MFSRSSSPSLRRPYGALARLFLVLGIAVLVLGFSYAGLGAPRGVPVAVLSTVIPPGGGMSSIVNATINLTDAPSFDPNALHIAANASLHLELVNTGVVN